MAEWISVKEHLVWVWSESTGFNALPRSDQYYSKDVFGNNLVPYNWEGDGCMIWKGQDVTYWAQTSAPPEENEHKIVTHADKIRDMTDEELADFLSFGVVGVYVCDFCERVSKPRAECNVDDCRKSSLKWLQQPAEEEDHGNQRNI